MAGVPMKKSIIPVAVLMLACTAQSHAAGGLYGAFGLGVLEFSNGGALIRPKQLVLRVGYNFNEYIGLGYEGSSSVRKDQLAGSEYGYDTSFVYLKGSLPINRHAALYILAGSAEVERTRSSGGASVTTSDDDTGIGFGIETIEGNVRFFLDHVTYFEDNDEYVDSMNLGAIITF